MEEINKRLNEIAEYYGLFTYAKFAAKTGLSHQTISNYLKGKQKPDVEKLSAIKQSFEEIDANWLLTGEGEMFKKVDEKDQPEGIGNQIAVKVKNEVQPIMAQMTADIIKQIKNMDIELSKLRAIQEELKRIQENTFKEVELIQRKP